MRGVAQLASEYPGVHFVDFVPEVDARWDFMASYVHLTEEANERLAELLRSTLLHTAGGA